MQTATRTARTGDRPPADKGCTYAPKCASCPWRVCIKELPDSEHRQFVVAWHTLRRFMAPVEVKGNV